MHSPDSNRPPKLLSAPSFYRLVLKPLLFAMDAETAHHLVQKIARLLWKSRAGRKLTRAIYARRIEPMPVTLAGMQLSSPLGLAAGFDKNALLVPGIETLGFGFIEIGTVTPRPQAGNPRPRMHRVPEKRALVNRMGFNNDGAEAVSARLLAVRNQLSVPLGVNLGKNRDTPNSEAVKDYETLFKAFSLTASYFVINISSPNTPGLRDLQSGEFIAALGERVLKHRLQQPVFVKLAPDVAHDDMKAIAQLCGAGRPYAGLILTNTIPTDLGGLSGYPLKGPSVNALRIARTVVSAEVPIISVGGIECADDILERFKNGANAVQIYSSMIYGGPGHPGRILRELQDKMRFQGIRELTELRQL